METDLNRISFEANPPFPIEFQNQLARPIWNLRLGAGSPAVLQEDYGQGLHSVQHTGDIGSFARLILSTPIPVIPAEVRDAAAIKPLPPSNTTSDQLQATATTPKTRKGVWDILESLAGTIDAPADWAAEHDHYLYGTLKRL